MLISSLVLKRIIINFIYFPYVRLIPLLLILFILSPFNALSSEDVRVPELQNSFLEKFREAYYNLKLIEFEPELKLAIQSIAEPERSAMQALLSYSKFSINLREDYEKVYFKEFTENASKAIELIENTLKKNPEDISAKLNLGLIYGLKGGVSLGYEKDYFDAYQFGSKGVSLLNEVHQKNPDFHDLELSKGILKIMIAQSTWYVRWLAPIILESGSIQEGIYHLDQVIEKGTYVSHEALLAHVLLLWGDIDENYLEKSTTALVKFIEIYPENLQIYVVLARGFWLLKEFEKSNYYALQGIAKLQNHRGQFASRYGLTIQSFMLYWHYRYLAHKKEWLKLLRQTQQRGDLPIQSTFRTVAMWNMGQYDAAKKLAKETSETLEQSSISMPLFIVPFAFDLGPTLQSILQENILAKDENE